MTNTDHFYSTAADFQRKRKEIMDDYERRMEGLESAKGSKYFLEESKKAEGKKDESLKVLNDEYTGYFNIALDAMRKANTARKMTPPTEEELRILQLLKMKDKPTEAELQAAANTLKGNATCLSVLTEIAHNAGYLRGYNNYSETKEMPVDTAEGIIKGLASSVRDFMDYDTPRAARAAMKHHNTFYGVNPDAMPLPKRPLFEDKAACFRTLAGGLTGDTLEAFQNAVDG